MSALNWSSPRDAPPKRMTSVRSALLAFDLHPVTNSRLRPLIAERYAPSAMRRISACLSETLVDEPQIGLTRAPDRTDGASKTGSRPCVMTTDICFRLRAERDTPSVSPRPHRRRERPDTFTGRKISRSVSPPARAARGEKCAR